MVFSYEKQNLIIIVSVVLFIFFLIALVKYFRVSDNQQTNSTMIGIQQKATDKMVR